MLRFYLCVAAAAGPGAAAAAVSLWHYTAVSSCVTPLLPVTLTHFTLHSHRDVVVVVVVLVVVVVKKLKLKLKIS